MGTDIYLSWTGMKEEDKRKQYTGFAINAGRYGYLRASIGMVEENETLRRIFPKEYWESDKPLEYDFEANYDKMLAELVAYLTRKLRPMSKEERLKKMADQNPAAIAVLDMFTELSKATGVQVVMPTTDLADAIVWAASVVEFFDLGVRLQREGRKPRVYISW